MSAFVIAEAGVNHNGDRALALRLADAAADCGADAVKFQTFRTDAIVTMSAAKADYQRRATDGLESQRAMLHRLELDVGDHLALVERCRQRGIAFLSTPFDLESLGLLTDTLGLQTIKIGSGDLTNGPLLHALACRGARTILSTGMATMDEVRDALGVLAHGYLGNGSGPSRPAFVAAMNDARTGAILRQRVTLLHCTTEYPAPFEDVNLRAMDSLREAFGLAVGLSDHTPGISVAIAAVARGATVIEKHVTLDRSLPGPDHKASLEPAEFAAMVRSIREIEAALGDGVKRPMPSEIANRAIARKGLVAARSIRKDESIDAAALAVKRPAAGASPMDYWDWLGRRAERDYAPDEAIGG